MAYKFNPFTGNFDDFNGPNGEFTSIDVEGDITLDDGGTYTTTLQTITPTAARTISFPDATGTVALVGGSSGQLVYNNAGAQAGASGSVVGATGDITLTLNGAASTPPLELTGTWFTGGTATTTKPQVLIEPTGATSTAWSTSGTGLGVNAASGFAGNLLDLQVNGTRQARITNIGDIWFGNTATGYFSAGASVLYLGPAGTAGVSSGGVVRAGAGIAFVNGNVSGIGDVFLSRLAAGVIRVADASANDATLNAQLRAAGTAPATASSTGTAGDIRYDADYIYICTAANTWKRAAISTW
jgi:hypothetical protein